MSKIELLVKRLKMAAAAILFALAGLCVIAPRGHAQSGEGTPCSTNYTSDGFGSSCSSTSG